MCPRSKPNASQGRREAQVSRVAGGMGGAHTWPMTAWAPRHGKPRPSIAVGETRVQYCSIFWVFQEEPEI